LSHVTVLGRDPETCDIALLSEAVSRKHAELRWTSARRFVLVDLGSTNGTRLDGQVVLRAIDLRSGQIIDVGGIELVFAMCAPSYPRGG
jgi:pSer/pThr/pTyr-binding forkhead associated (FHA) protein